MIEFVLSFIKFFFKVEFVLSSNGILKKSIEEDEKKYKEMGKRLAEDRDYSKLFNKKS